MFLSDKSLKKWAEDGGVSPFNPLHVNPASIDLTLGEQWRDLDTPDIVRTSNPIKIYSPLDGAWARIVGFFYQKLHLKLAPPIHPTAILAVTQEWVEIPDDMVGMIKLKSTPTRMGLGHPIADWIDPGYKGKLTLMLNAVKTATLPVGIRIVQLTVAKLDYSVEVSYAKTGHYMYQMSPTMARSDYVPR